MWTETILFATCCTILDRMSHFKCFYLCSLVLLTRHFLPLYHSLTCLRVYSLCQRPHVVLHYWLYKYYYSWCCCCWWCCCRCCSTVTGCWIWNGTAPLHHQMKSFPFCMRLKLDTVFIIVEISKRWIRKTTAENILHSPFFHMDKKWRRMKKNTRTITWNILFCWHTHTHTQIYFWLHSDSIQFQKRWQSAFHRTLHSHYINLNLLLLGFVCKCVFVSQFLLFGRFSFFTQCSSANETKKNSK